MEVLAAAVVLAGSVAGQSPLERRESLRGRLPWTPNYCNSSILQREAGLTKTALGSFVGYACAGSYFFCEWSGDGWRSYRRVCQTGHVFDPTGLQNCTFKERVPACQSEDQKACQGNCVAAEWEFECCLSEECKAAGKRCDGRFDCTLEEDEMDCARCKPGEFPCATADLCVSMTSRCDGTDNCPDASDERFCSVCEAGNFYCAGSKRCVPATARCNGEKDCTYGEDEVYCWEPDPFQCEDANESLVPMEKKCDGTEDCPDGSDEAACATTAAPTIPPEDLLQGEDGGDYQDKVANPKVVKPGK